MAVSLGKGNVLPTKNLKLKVQIPCKPVNRFGTGRMRGCARVKKRAGEYPQEEGDVDKLNLY
jgi:hypothetical protein